MNTTGRAYNALTGAELKQAILNEVSRALDNVGFNSPAVTYPGASWAWRLDIYQKDSEGKPLGETPERHVEAGAADPRNKLANSLLGGSKRYQDDPPSPTKVRQQNDLPLPEA